VNVSRNLVLENALLLLRRAADGFWSPNRFYVNPLPNPAVGFVFPTAGWPKRKKP